VYIRAFKPDILGTEKLMDVALITTILKQGHLPIENPWLSGFLMNYYYLGHFICSGLLYLFNISPNFGYNLLISLIGVLSFQAAYSFLEKIIPPGKKILAVIASVVTIFWRKFLLFMGKTGQS